MVSCKVAPYVRRLGASLAHHARGFCHTVDAGESSSLRVLTLLEKNVKASGKQLVSALRRIIQEEDQARLLLLQCLEEGKKEKAGKVLLQRLEEERQARKEKERLLEGLVEVQERLVEVQERLVEEQKRLVEELLQLRAKDKIELLRARGLNETLGLFEMVQERLAQAPNITAGKEGEDLWEEILTSDAGLAACIERCTKVSAANKSEQAMHCYLVYEVLLQHVHAGKELAHLRAQSGRIEFQRGPLSPEQVEVLVCLGSAAGVKLVPLE